jgi:hydrogenase maturation protease
MAHVMVLGLGDAVQQDKGVGIRAVRDLYREQWPDGVRFGDRRMLDSLSLSLEGVHGLLVLDAWQSGMEPGSLARLSLDQVLQRPGLVSEPALWRSLAFADVLGQDLQVVFLGLEAGQTACDLTFSPEVCDAYPRFLAAIREEIVSMLTHLDQHAAPADAEALP